MRNIKQNIIFIFFIFSIQVGFSQKTAQKDTIYFDQKWEVTTKSNALYYRLSSHIKSKKIWQVKDYYIDTNTLQALFSSKDSIGNIVHGKVKWFDKNEDKTNEAYYFNGNQINKEQYELKNIKEEHNIDLVDDKELLSSKKVFITNDTIADHIFLSKDSNGTRLTIQFNSHDHHEHVQSFYFENEEDLYDIDAQRQRLTLIFKNDKRIYNWERKLIFNVIENNSEEEYEEVYILKLIKDNAIAERKLKRKKLNISRTNREFGEIYLSEYSNFKDEENANNYTWQEIQNFIKFDTPEELQYEFEENTFTFLNSIKDDTIIKLNSDIYNFSTPRNYIREISKDKYVKMESGILEISGFSNLKIIGKDEVIFVTEESEVPVLRLENCKNITFKNIEAVHAIEETYCDASVFDINSSKKINFNNCIADGSGRYGFSIFNSNHIYITNSIIRNCNDAAIYYGNSKNVKLSKVKIMNNTLNEIFMVSNSCESYNEQSIILKNSTIKNNNFNYLTKCPKDIVIKNSTIQLNKDDKITTSGKEKELKFTRVKLKYND